jgi:spermidine/putrescine transport system substrate-binding protein
MIERGPAMKTNRLLSLAGALLVVLLAASCGRKDDAAPAKTETGAAADDRPSGTLHLYNWNNYIAPETIQRFETEFNAKVVQTYFSDNDEMLAKLAAGATGYDLIVPTGNALELMIKKGDLQPIDHAKLPNIKNLKPEFLNTPFDPGNKFSVPYAYSTTVIGYNDRALKMVGLEPKGWESIFDPNLACKLKGKLTVLDSPDEVFSAAFIYLGIDPNTHSVEDYKKAAETIKTAKPCWAAFNSSSYIKELSAGNIWLALGYSTDMYQANLDAQAAKQDFHIVPVMPTQGAVMSLDNMVLHKAAPNPALAHAFINFLLEGKNGSELTNMIGSGNANAAAMEFIKADVKENVTVFPDAASLKKLHQLRFLPTELRQERGRLWTAIKVAR